MPIQFEVVKGEAEDVCIRGRRSSRATVLMRVKRGAHTLSISRKALILGAVLALSQLLDGILTYIGLNALGVNMEGNTFLRVMMYSYGVVPTLCVAKTAAVVMAVVLMLNAHSRKWVRPIICLLVMTYITIAIVPWVNLIAS